MSLSLLDIAGPVMVGPSSSHTAGAVKLGQFARAFRGKPINKVSIYLHGSFGIVYKGHATDRALVAGLLNLSPSDERIRDAFSLAKKENLTYTFISCTLGVGFHPNTVKFVVHEEEVAYTIIGASIGGGAIRITHINGFDVHITEDMKDTYTIIVMHADGRGILHTITSALTTENNNIAAVTSLRTAKNGDAMTVIQTDERISPQTLERIQQEQPAIYSLFELT